jgi:hypothetical protein
MTRCPKHPFIEHRNVPIHMNDYLDSRQPSWDVLEKAKCVEYRGDEYIDVFFNDTPGVVDMLEFIASKFPHRYSFHEGRLWGLLQ